MNRIYHHLDPYRNRREFKWSEWYPPAVLVQVRVGRTGRWFTLWPWDLDLDGKDHHRLDDLYWRLTAIAKEWGVENL